ncbi:MAG: hypothetical protein A2504_12830 [Bdellovibrionales bacterium RIFOXYD12_FULL_39_22]|nr:MAG: hypothetical protein A2385_03915 [Bdellovibrionales bacterium RIFOXYB1_FULL_39_21]OFZ40499.1 MAG: hypothetical protein A2485_02780 [Bdellovibrionales bacterium RIFOXYC12_FULL_39_17]OFZ49982.1 MAG: hypothetical protein A2404_02115 [Bdellovibrionales bacterium RIFOXYC1_FULL_39_130]OFZ77624.1 MAG: hypothetical protein A2560_04675 [Bdellovibrionales bacterium RIFOXYD1_FULL_39_84]OFZ96078.1 MAG: hypothetical protein A2504_12830 [Bdellovibrionales bacterium RIFOXYD12_FULL_39_22]HLE10633.1 AB
MNTKRIQNSWVIAQNTILKELRNKTLIGLAIFTVIIIFIINGSLDYLYLKTSDMTATGGASPIDTFFGSKFSVFYTMINFWNGLLATIIGVGAIQSDREHGALYQILALPIHKLDYLLGRVVGTWLIVVGYYIASMLLGIIIFALFSSKIELDYPLFLSFPVTTLAIFTYILCAMLISSFLNRSLALIATMFTMWVASIANSSFATISISEIFSEMGMLKTLGIIPHFLLPRAGTINNIASGILKDSLPPLNYPLEATHFLLSTALLIFINYKIFSAQEK